MYSCYRLSEEPMENAVSIGEAGYIRKCECREKEYEFYWFLTHCMHIRDHVVIEVMPNDSEESIVYEDEFPILISPQWFVQKEDGEPAGFYFNGHFFPHEGGLREQVNTFETTGHYDWGDVRVTHLYDTKVYAPDIDELRKKNS